jgi:crotonobetainyl-CoA:carnitine CoA-transferase CaiB-like acyl-CoA transferase
MPAPAPLSALRVVDVSSGIAGGYCCKLLADFGADVVKVEPPDGDPLRRWSASHTVEPGAPSGALFRHLYAGARSVVAEPDDVAFGALLEGADVLVESYVPARLDVAAIRARHPRLVVVSITPFGRTGPFADRPANEFLAQAEAGAVASRGPRDRPPIQAGGRIMAWLAGAFAAVAAVAAVRGARRHGDGEHVDLALAEVAEVAGTGKIDLAHALAGRPPVTGPARVVETPSIEPTADGLVGFMTMTRQHFENFLLLIERPDLVGGEWTDADERVARMDEWNAIVRSWTRRHTTAQIIDAAREFRVPVADVNNGRTVQGQEQFASRAVFATHPDGDFVQPLPPFRVAGERVRPRGPSPGVGEHDGRIEPRPHPPPSRLEPRPSRLPLEGLRILDATLFWAGPSATQLLAALGAEVVHLEAVKRVDGYRLTGPAAAEGDWWERGLFCCTNTDKLDVTLDLDAPEGRDLFFRLVGKVDALVENYSPRVFDNFGITWELVEAANPHVVMVRMPAFGLDGPWRHNLGFAQTMEQTTGLAWITGYRDEPPRIMRGPCDPLAGVHAALAVLAGLAERDRVHRGVLIEAAMAETALAAAAEQVVEWSAYGALMERDGNRGPDAAPQGVYPCAGTEQWVAIAVVTDDQWRALRDALGRPAWAMDPPLDASAGRRCAHDVIDEQLARWTAAQAPDAVVAALVERGVPVARVVDPRDVDRHPQFVHRRFIETLDHPVAGAHPVAAVPFRFERVPRWHRRRAPLLGEHNREVLGGWLGVTDDELARLAALGVIGTRPTGV